MFPQRRYINMTKAKPIATSIPANVKIITENINPAASSIAKEAKMKPKLADTNIISILIRTEIKFFFQSVTPKSPKIKIFRGNKTVRSLSSI